MPSRPLKPEERVFARTVFGDSLDYDAVAISTRGIAGQVITTHFAGRFTIRWPNAYVDIMGDAGRRSTFIHELTHVWQGSHDGQWAGAYQVRSVVAQLWAGLRSIARSGDWLRGWRRWDAHRSTAYRLDAADFGRPWTYFNVEQQGMIVQTWYETEAVRHRRGDDGPGVTGGAMSADDPRYPYIRDVIRARDPRAPYRR